MLYSPLYVKHKSIEVNFFIAIAKSFVISKISMIGLAYRFATDVEPSCIAQNKANFGSNFFKKFRPIGIVLGYDNTFFQNFTPHFHSCFSLSNIIRTANLKTVILTPCFQSLLSLCWPSL